MVWKVIHYVIYCFAKMKCPYTSWQFINIVGYGFSCFSYWDNQHVCCEPPLLWWGNSMLYACLCVYVGFRAGQQEHTAAEQYSRTAGPWWRRGGGAQGQWWQPLSCYVWRRQRCLEPEDTERSRWLGNYLLDCLTRTLWAIIWRFLCWDSFWYMNLCTSLLFVCPCFDSSWQRS